jgi:hypothetical protein
MICIFNVLVTRQIYRLFLSNKIFLFDLAVFYIQPETALGKDFDEKTKNKASTSV